MSKPTYRELFRSPGFTRILTTQLLARFPFGMMSIALVMHIQHLYGNYTTAGVALGAETVGAAISNPVLGRAMSKYGIRQILLPSATISAICTFAVLLVTNAPLLTVFFSLSIGLFSPPIQAAARTVYPSMVKKRLLPILFSFDAASQEIIWVIGPVLATLLAAQFNTAFPVITMGIIQILGAISFTANPEVKDLKIPASTRRIGGVLKNKLVLVNLVLGMLLIGSFSGVEVGTVALYDKHTAGWLIASLSVGSMLGGVLIGRHNHGRWALTRFLVLVCIGYGLVLVTPSVATWVALCWFIAGLGVAPALGVLGAIIGVKIKPADSAEAYGWIGTGQLVGYSAGAALAGIVIDTISPVAALAISIVLGLAAVSVAALTVRITPDLGEPHHDTTSITIIKE